MLATPELLREAAVEGRLAAVLPGYLKDIPLYRLASQGRPPKGVEDLGRLPFITKADLRRDFPRNFLGEEADLESLIEAEAIELEHTAGTSEERTPLLLPRGWWAEQ